MATVAAYGRMDLALAREPVGPGHQQPSAQLPPAMIGVKTRGRVGIGVKSVNELRR
jgi:hypothetical protein